MRRGLAVATAHRMKSIVSAAIAICALASAARGQQTVGLFDYDPSRFFVGYTLFAPTRSTTTYLIDMYGYQVHAWSSAYTPGQSCMLLENGHLLRTANASNPVFTSGGTGGRVQDLEWDGTLGWDYLYSNNQHCQHHDIERLPNGDVLMIAWERKTQAEAIAAGRNPALITAQGLWPDHLVQVRPTGATTGMIVWEWHLWDHLVQDFDASMPNYGVVADHPELVNLNYPNNNQRDWTHVNAVHYDPTFDQIVLSVHNTDEIWVLDHSTTSAEAAGHTGGSSERGGDLLYRWGNPEAYGRGTPADQRLFGQHDSQWIADSLPGARNFLLFNNGLGRGYSSLDELVPPVDANGVYGLAPGAAYGPSALAWSYTAAPPTSLYAANVSGAQRLPNGNTLACDGPHGAFFEVTSDGTEVWRYVNPVIASGPLASDDPIPGGSTQETSVFRCYRYASAYPGLAGRTLEPIGLIERGSSTDASRLESAGLALEALSPVRGDATVRFHLGSAQAVRLALHDVRGRLVRVIFEGAANAGARDATLDVRGLPAGVYILSLTTPSARIGRRLVTVP